MSVWSSHNSQQIELLKIVFLHMGYFFSLSWVTFSTDSCIRLICTTYSEMFVYFTLKINFPPLSLLYKEATLPPKGKHCFQSFSCGGECKGHWLHVAPHTVGWGTSLKLWQLAERKDFEADTNLAVMKSVKHLLYLIRKHQVILSSSCLCLLVHSFRKARSSSRLRPALRVSFWAPGDSEKVQGLESGDLRICSGSDISTL